MKTRFFLPLPTIIGTALFLHITTASAQFLDSVESLRNRAIAASPRALEVFPWLARGASKSTTCCGQGAKVSDVSKRREFAGGPRLIEQFPELVRPAARLRAVSPEPIAKRNRAFLSSPRAREEFPELSQE